MTKHLVLTVVIGLLVSGCVRVNAAGMEAVGGLWPIDMLSGPSEADPKPEE